MLALAAATLFWSGNFIAGRALRDDIDPALLNLLRWAISLLLFLPFVGGRLHRHLPVVRREWPLILGLGTTGIAAFHLLVYLALQHTTAINALLMVSLAPAVILAGAGLTGAGRPSPLQWVGTAVSLVGAGVLITRADPDVIFALALNPGDLWMLLAVLVWAAYSLLLRRRPPDLPQDVALAASIVPALLMMLPLVAVMTPAAPPAFSLGTLAVLGYIAVFASLLAFLLWSYGVDIIGPARAGQFVHLMPVFGTVLAIVLLGERLVAAQLIGAVIVFAGIVLVNRGAPRSRADPVSTGPATSQKGPPE